MVLDINLLVLLRNKKNQIKKLSKSLFFRLGFLLLLFTSVIISVLYYQFNYSYSTQDSILDAHESFYYSKMVDSWGSPPDTELVKQDIINLHLHCMIFKIENDYNPDRGYGPKFWSYPLNMKPEIFYAWSYPEDFEKHGVFTKYEVTFGTMNEMPATAVATNDFVYYFRINYKEPSEVNNFILVSVVTIFSMIGLGFFIQRYLYPVFLMKQRVFALEQGDLDSKIPIIGDDELASLSKALNKMIEDIRYLLNQKQQLLLDVSHELRTPLARMQLLIEMLPEHRNIEKLKKEVFLLEGMISNMLMSDRLSTPYQNLDKSKIKLSRIIKKVLDMFPEKVHLFEVNSINDININVDEMKFSLAIRNLLDNAQKYANSDKKIKLYTTLENNCLKINVQDFGSGISKKDMDKLTNPFYRILSNNNKKPGFGLGLTICKKVVNAHGGKLEITSKVGKGSVFSLIIPI